jgi:hypothetical protein
VLLYWSSRAEAAPVSALLLPLKVLSIGVQCIPGDESNESLLLLSQEFVRERLHRFRDR